MPRAPCASCRRSGASIATIASEWMLKSGGIDIVLRGIEGETIHFVQWP